MMAGHIKDYNIIKYLCLLRIIKLTGIKKEKSKIAMAPNLKRSVSKIVNRHVKTLYDSIKKDAFAT